jgi:protocatechuate 3,4-dioxygenase beta subunit
MEPTQTRRAFLAATGALALGASLGVAVRAQETMPTETAPADAGTPQQLPLTPECVDADDLTPAQTEGPYFTRNSPERWSLLEDGMPGTQLLLSGYVMTQACQPIATALLDFWQCDASGVYDNVGYRLRGHQFTDEFGRYALQTVVPGLYPGRTRHIHLKVQAPGGRILTTQLYFDGEPRNRTDGIFDPALSMSLTDVEGGQAGTFNFVVTTA